MGEFTGERYCGNKCANAVITSGLIHKRIVHCTACQKEILGLQESVLFSVGCSSYKGRD
jgi:hypothetical protein